MRLPLLLLLTSLSFTIIKAQKFDLKYAAGAANYSGELQNKGYTFNQAGLVGGIGLEYAITEHFVARADLSIAKISAADRYSTEVLNRARNLDFTTNIVEGALNLEYDFLNLQNFIATPYVFTGVAVYHFNPYTKNSQGDHVYLQALGTEGQGFNGTSKYNLTQVAIPYGGGIKIAITDQINLGFEIGFRKLFTDYLDDVSGNYADESILPAATIPYAYRGTGAYPVAGMERGHSSKKDDYYFTLLTLSFKLNNDRETDFTKMQLRQIQCPTNVNTMILY